MYKLIFLLNFCFLSMVFGSEKKISEQDYKQELQEVTERIRTKTAEFIEGKTDNIEIDEFCEQIIDKLSNLSRQSGDTSNSDAGKNLEKKYLYDDIEANIAKIHSEVNTEFSFRLNLVAEKFLFCNHLMHFSTLKENSDRAREIINSLLFQEEKCLCEYMKSLKKWFFKFYEDLEEFGRLGDKLSETISKETSTIEN